MRSGLKVRKCNLWSLSSLSIKRAPSWLPALSVWEESFEFCEWQLYVRITDEQHAKCNNSAKQSQQRENRDDFECAPLPPPGRHYSVSGCGAHGSGPVIVISAPSGVHVNVCLAGGRRAWPTVICAHNMANPVVYLEARQERRIASTQLERRPASHVARVRPTAVLLAAHLPIPDRSISTAFVATFFPMEAAAKLSIEEFYQVTPAGKLQAADVLHRHPERIGSNKITPNLENIANNDSSGPSNAQSAPVPNSNITQANQKSPHVKRAKWHLGIRSQSRPEDIMYEVFRAMKTLDFEWKVLNPYHVIVRKRPDNPTYEPVVEICAFIIAWRELSGSPIGVFEHCCLQPKMSLQLYQVDQKSYLLDFKSLVDEDNGSASSSRHASVSMPVKPSLRANRAQSLPMPMEVDQTPPPSPTVTKQSQTMQFFEMCASLIGTLAR
uniref:AdenylateSensor domain-containing protein n=1 Tax=Ascaris lumbricoides TaxID=6252 RepID=A0A0M3HST6_ASCLU